MQCMFSGQYAGIYSTATQECYPDWGCSSTLSSATRWVVSSSVVALLLFALFL
jgi:hypothetical protein